MVSLTERGQAYASWLHQLKVVASDKTNTPLWEIKVNEDEAFEYYKDGFTPAQCFRETWASDGD